MKTENKVHGYEQDCYGFPEGMTEEDFLAEIRETSAGPMMIATSVLSDAQALIELGTPPTLELARQAINRAKLIMHECMVVKKGKK